MQMHGVVPQTKRGNCENYIIVINIVVVMLSPNSLLKGWDWNFDVNISFKF